MPCGAPPALRGARRPTMVSAASANTSIPQTDRGSYGPGRTGAALRLVMNQPTSGWALQEVNDWPVAGRTTSAT